MTLKKLLQKQEKKYDSIKPSSHSCRGFFFFNKIKALIYTITEIDLIYIYGTLK